MRLLVHMLTATVLIFGSASTFAKNGMGKGLPPGLQKKVLRGQALPPGWQKKLVKGKILDVNIFKLGKIIAPPDPLGIMTINVEGQVLKVHKTTRKILKILP